MTAESIARLRLRVDAAGGALRQLEDVAPGMPEILVGLLGVVAEEAARTPRFARSIDAVLRGGTERPAVASARRAATAGAATSGPSARRTKRAAGVLDPFDVHRAGGEGGLREQLASLTVEQLKDIVAEHAMDYDKLAMRWKTPSRLRDRIVERVSARETKGDAFR